MARGPAGGNAISPAVRLPSPGGSPSCPGRAPGYLRRIVTHQLRKSSK